MFLILIFIIGICFLLEYLSTKRDLTEIKCGISCATSRVEPGEKITVETTVSNRGYLPVTFALLEQYFPIMSSFATKENVGVTKAIDANRWCKVTSGLRIPAHRRVIKTSEIVIGKRGRHYFGVEKLTVGDFLGIKEMSIHLSNNEESILVYPKRFEDDSIVKLSENLVGEALAKQQLLRDPIVVIGNRDYTGREPMHDINWAQTAKRGNLMVREYDYIGNPSVCVLLSVSGIMADEEEKLDWACSYTRTLIEELLDRGVDVEFFTNGYVPGFNGKVWHSEVSKNKVGELLEVLSLLTFRTNSSTEELRNVVAYQRGNQDNVFVIAPGEND